MTFKNLHLIVSIFIIFPVAVVYGFNPGGLQEKLFDFKIVTVDLLTIFKAVMGLYISMASFWFAGIIKPALWRTGTLTNILLMGGLAFGRVISLLFDGIPSSVFLIGLALEILLAVWDVFNLRNYK